MTNPEQYVEQPNSEQGPMILLDPGLNQRLDPSSRPTRILVVEDDAALARVIQLRLTRLGYEVLLERDGKRGLEIVKADGCDLTLLDYKLPGMDGLEVMRVLSEQEVVPAVIMLSGVGDLSTAVEAMKLGATDYVIKEVNRGYFDLLEATIERALEKKRFQAEKLATEKHLAQTSAQLAGTLTSINEGLCVFDSSLSLVLCNDRFIRLYDYPAELVCPGTPLSELFGHLLKGLNLSEAEQSARIASKIAGAVPRLTRIYEEVLLNGTVIEVRANPMPDGGFVSTHTDITDRKSNEKALLESQDRYRRLSEFASSVIHNVGNILSSINVACGALHHALRHSKIPQVAKTASLISANTENPEFFKTHPKGKLLPEYLERLSETLNGEQEEHLEEVQGILKNLMLITQIIEYQQSQGRRDELVEILDLRQVVDDALNVKMDALSRAAVEVDVQLNVFLVRIQKAKLTHVLINLVKNAIEAMAVQAPPRVLSVRSGHLADGHVFLSFQDTGVGIAPEHLANLFSHGFTTKEHGHGFGLHYCANALREMNCRIEATSEGRGQGATFTIIFLGGEAIDE